MDSENIQIENNKTLEESTNEQLCDTHVQQNVEENVEHSDMLHRINNVYKTYKMYTTKIINEKLVPVIQTINEKYGKYLTVVFFIIAICFDYVNVDMLKYLYFLYCLITTIKTVKSSNQDNSNVLLNWIAYASLTIIFELFDVLLSWMGSIFTFVFTMCKFLMLFVLFDSEETIKNLSSGTIKIYSCNNRIIDLLQKETYKVLKFVHETTKNNVNKMKSKSE